MAEWGTALSAATALTKLTDGIYFYHDDDILYRADERSQRRRDLASIWPCRLTMLQRIERLPGDYNFNRRSRLDRQALQRAIDLSFGSSPKIVSSQAGQAI